MSKARDLFLGGNTCYGFYSFYDFIVSENVLKKYIFKGGPGVGKSFLMKKIATEFAARGYDVEYYWCSSDNNSLDGIVLGNKQICLIDGTTPHIVEPKFPGAVDEIINLGQFWNKDLITDNRTNIINLTNGVSKCFQRAYLRLQEVNCAYSELKTYYEEASDSSAVKRNIIALSEDFLEACTKATGKVRHLFSGAITPEGIVTKLGSIIDKDMSLYTVKGSPGSGVKDLLTYVAYIVEANAIEAEIFHNPFNPDEIDLILLPETRAVLIDLSDTFLDYSGEITSTRYKRQLDFDQFIDESILDLYVKNIDSAQNRIEFGLKEAITVIAKAKDLHDKLEDYYVPAMDFEAVEVFYHELLEEIAQNLRI
ncbi:MAG TPA: hypothetical protein VFC73_03200 [Syntrophomonadaceae bacterium]|nr:hypothetical protein [Syntrophomonadaceae bacterium]